MNYLTRPLLLTSALFSCRGFAWGARVADMTGTVFTQDRQAQPASPFTVPCAMVALALALWLCSDRGLRSMVRVRSAIRLTGRLR